MRFPARVKVLLDRLRQWWNDRPPDDEGFFERYPIIPPP